MKIRKKHIGEALVLILIITAGSAVAMITVLVEWPFISASPFSLNPGGPGESGLGFLEINSSFVLNGVRGPIRGGLLSLSSMPGTHHLSTNKTDDNGTIWFELREGSYYFSLNSPQGDDEGTVNVYSGYTTLVVYTSVNYSEAALSFDVVTLQPGYAAPWDRVYVLLPNPFYGLNLSLAEPFIQPLYSAANVSLSSSTNLTRVDQFIRKIQSPTISEVESTVVSEEISSSGTSWLQLKPVSAFSLTGLLGIAIADYNFTSTISVYKGPPSMG